MLTNEIDGIIAYCDGGASPNPGPTGSGIHLYTYRYPTEKERPTKVGTRHIATDHGYVLQKDIKPDQKPVMIIEYVERATPLNIGTNNIGEIHAAIQACSIATQFNAKELKIITDSTMVVKGINEWLDGWKQKGWRKSDGESVKNKELWMGLDAAIQQLKPTTGVKAIWVLGHNDDYGNVIADQLATLGVRLSATNKQDVRESRHTLAEFKQIEQPIHPFLCLKRVYFNSDEELNVPGLYYQTDASDDKFILGKRTSEAVFSVVKLSYPDKLIETIIESSCQRKDATNAVLYTQTSRLNNSELQRISTLYGSDCFIPSSKNMNVDFLDKRPVVHEVKEGELSLRAVDVLAHLEEILSSFHEANGSMSTSAAKLDTRYRIYDITDSYYTPIIKKSKGIEVESAELKKEHANGVESAFVTLPIVFPNSQTAERKLELIFGLDLPTRNTLKKLEVLNPQVYVITWNFDEKGLQYGVVVRTDSDLGIWTSYFSNVLYLTKA